MSLSCAAALPQPTLADAIDETLAVALDGGRVLCLWCGGAARIVGADRFGGRVVVRCPECGAELEGVRSRRTAEARA